MCPIEQAINLGTSVQLLKIQPFRRTLAFLQDLPMGHEARADDVTADWDVPDPAAWRRGDEDARQVGMAEIFDLPLCPAPIPPQGKIVHAVVVLAQLELRSKQCFLAGAVD
jgi:hypothetical protein